MRFEAIAPQGDGTSSRRTFQLVCQGIILADFFTKRGWTHVLIAAFLRVGRGFSRRYALFFRLLLSPTILLESALARQRYPL